MIEAVDKSKIDLFRPLIEERVAEAQLGERMPADLAFSTVKMQIQSGMFQCFTDNTSDPKGLLVLIVGNISFFVEKTCSIAILHVSKDYREQNPAGAARMASEFVRHAEVYARSQGCNCLRAGSWVWRDSKDIGAIYERAGMEVQSTEYVKMVNEKGGEAAA